MSHRFLTSIMSLLLLSCAGSSKPVEETVSRPRIAASGDESKPAPADTRKAPATGTANSESTAKPEAQGQPDAKTAAAAEPADGWPVEDFSGVDTTAPKDSETAQGPREVEVKGIEGTTSRYDVRTTLQNRDSDFDRCHDLVGGSGGRIVFRIHIEANGDVGGVKVSTQKVKNRKLVDCYTEVVASSHFTRPHGGYADVKWTTKVGRSRRRPDAIFERRGRWDTPAGGSSKPEAEANRRRKSKAGRKGA